MISNVYFDQVAQPYLSKLDTFPSAEFFLEYFWNSSRSTIGIYKVFWYGFISLKHGEFLWRSPWAHRLVDFQVEYTSHTSGAVHIPKMLKRLL